MVVKSAGELKQKGVSGPKLKAQYNALSELGAKHMCVHMTVSKKKTRRPTYKVV